MVDRYLVFVSEERYKDIVPNAYLNKAIPEWLLNKILYDHAEEIHSEKMFEIVQKQKHKDDNKNEILQHLFT